MILASPFAHYTGFDLGCRVAAVILSVIIILGGGWLLWRKKDQPVAVELAAARAAHVVHAENAHAVQRVLHSVDDLGKVVVAWSAQNGEVVYLSAAAHQVLGVNYTTAPQMIGELEPRLQDMLKGREWQQEFIKARISRRNEAYPKIVVMHHTQQVPCELRPAILWSMDHCILVADIISIGGHPYPLAELHRSDAPPPQRTE